METHSGILDSIWVNTITPLVISFIVESTSERILCVLSDSEVANKLLFLPNRDYTVEVIGKSISNDQFIVDQITIRNPDRNTKKLGL